MRILLFLIDAVIIGIMGYLVWGIYQAGKGAGKDLDSDLKDLGLGSKEDVHRKAEATRRMAPHRRSDE